MDSGRFAVESVHTGVPGPLRHEGFHLREEMVSTKPWVYDRLPCLCNRRIGSFHGDGEMACELAPRRYRHAGAHQSLLLEFPDPVRIVDVVPVVTVAVGPVDTARKLKGFLRMHHAYIQRDILRCSFLSSAVLVLGGAIPDVGMRKVL